MVAALFMHKINVVLDLTKGSRDIPDPVSKPHVSSTKCLKSYNDDFTLDRKMLCIN